MSSVHPEQLDIQRGVPAEEPALRGHHPLDWRCPMRGRSLHVRPLLVVGLIASAIVATLALGSSPSAVAGNPHPLCNSPTSQVVSCHFSGSFADNDFCGTGQTVDVAFDGRFTVPVDPNQPAGSSNNSEQDVVLTNPSTGATVLRHSAYRFTATLISG